jgi:G:T/U-mismatch repair DNA glycosylase
MQTLPSEIQRLIFQFRGPHPICNILKPFIDKWKEGQKFKHYRNYFFKVYFKHINDKAIDSLRLTTLRLVKTIEGRHEVLCTHTRERDLEILYKTYKTKDLNIIAIKEVYKYAARRIKDGKINWKYI